MTAAEVDQAIRKTRLVAILRASAPDRLPSAAQVLVEEGVRTLEFPLTGPGVLEAVAEAARTLAGHAFVGAGTVRTVEDARRAVDAGATFLVSPSLSVPVIEFAREHDVEVLPGTFTPTEIDTALHAGANIVKLFPATGHDPEFIRQLRVPIPEAAVVPTGGVSLTDAPAWLAAGAAALGVGSPLTGTSIDTGDWRRLRSRARDWLEAVS
jgi:2-dehydro-3-deoxyphosphogluconate aldolase/(4S)-4-hydroxy-2-oxoglutarate aldolase